MAYPNYFENPTPTTISDNLIVNATNSIQHYSLPSESLEFTSNRNGDLVNEAIFPMIDNIAQIPNEKSATEFSCKHFNCKKTYATISGLNNHMKK